VKALLLVDIQNDFLPGGALAAKQGNKILPVVNRLLEHSFDKIVATKDWHPADHGSFAFNHPGKKPGDVIELEGIQQILWPVHCVQGTPGSEFSPKWHSEKVGKVFYKGTEKNIDSYSSFFDNGHKRATGLGEYLKEKGIKDVYVAGLVTDYCVKYSVLDACHLGFKVFVVLDACCSIELQPGDTQRAIQEMEAAGAKMLTSQDLLSSD